MIKKIISYFFLVVGAIMLISFEAAIGMPLLYIVIVLQVLHNHEGFAKIALGAGLAVPLAMSLNISLTLVFILLTIATLLMDRVKQRTILQYVSFASLCVLIVVIIGRLELLPLSFVYLFSVWIIAFILTSWSISSKRTQRFS